MNHGLRQPRGIVIVDTHHLGDALMTFPLAGKLRRRWPQAKIYFTGLPYIKPLVATCEYFDGFIDSRQIVEDPVVLKRLNIDIFLNPFPDDALARAAFLANIPIRPGNLFRKTAVYCNRFVAYNSTLGDHVLKFKLRHLRPLGFRRLGREVFLDNAKKLYGLTRTQPLADEVAALIDPYRFNLILHPKSGGSGREWPLTHYLSLARTLTSLGTFKLFITGTAAERAVIADQCPLLLDGSYAEDLMGRQSLDQLLSFIAATDGLLASGTGPIHFAAALNRHALGLYPAGLGLNPLAWGPVGPKAITFYPAGVCRPGEKLCPKAKGPPCPCISSITPTQVTNAILTLSQNAAVAA